MYRIGFHPSPSYLTRPSENRRDSLCAMGSDGLVTGVEALAKHKVAGSTPVTRSQEVAELARGFGLPPGSVDG